MKRSTVVRKLRQSVSLSPKLAGRIRSLARSRGVSASKIIVSLIETGIESQEREKERFLALAEQLVHSKDSRQQRILKDELARMVFGE
jgi:hypothetical protein